MGLAVNNAIGNAAIQVKQEYISCSFQDSTGKQVTLYFDVYYKAAQAVDKQYFIDLFHRIRAQRSSSQEIDKALAEGFEINQKPNQIYSIDTLGSSSKQIPIKAIELLSPNSSYGIDLANFKPLSSDEKKSILYRTNQVAQNQFSKASPNLLTSPGSQTKPASSIAENIITVLEWLKKKFTCIFSYLQVNKFSSHRSYIEKLINVIDSQVQGLRTNQHPTALHYAFSIAQQLQDRFNQIMQALNPVKSDPQKTLGELFYWLKAKVISRWSQISSELTAELNTLEREIQGLEKEFIQTKIEKVINGLGILIYVVAEIETGEQQSKASANPQQKMALTICHWWKDQLTRIEKFIHETIERRKISEILVKIETLIQNLSKDPLTQQTWDDFQLHFFNFTLEVKSQVDRLSPISA